MSGDARKMDELFWESSRRILSALSMREMDSVIELVKITKLSYANVHKSIKRLEKLGVVLTHKDRRERTVVLSDDGLKIAKHVGKIRAILNRKGK
jgi:predicted transcriptional regulator